MLQPGIPAVVLAPMEGVTDAPMRAVQAEWGAFTYAVSEFIRVSATVPPRSVFYRHVPELGAESEEDSPLPVPPLPVQVQLLGGDPERMAASAVVACDAGARAIDINFGCPAPTVNQHDGGATLLKYPRRIRQIVAAIRNALPPEIPVSAKLRLGWDSIDAILENAEMAAEGGASWLTIHGRTREQGYRPPAYWEPIGAVRERLGNNGSLPIVANGDIWTLDAFRRCREVTGCCHFMLGRGALANPLLSHQVARELGLIPAEPTDRERNPPFRNADWIPLIESLACHGMKGPLRSPHYIVKRVKGWLKMASLYGGFTAFEEIKCGEELDEILAVLRGSAPDGS